MNKKEKRVVITGLGPLSSAGTGVDALWKGILAKDTGLVKEDLFVDGQLWDSFWYHKIKHFDINDFGIDKQILADINHWKRGKEDRDLNYLLAAVKPEGKEPRDLSVNGVTTYCRPTEGKGWRVGIQFMDLTAEDQADWDEYLNC